MELAFVFIFGLGIWIYSQGKKIEWLMKEVERLRSGVKEGSGGARETSAPTPAQPASFIPEAVRGRTDLTPNDVPREVLETYMPQVSGSAWSDNAVEWIKKDFMVKLGAFLLLLAFGWFVSYAFANNWIGPMGRIFLGLVTGVLFMVLGVWRIEKRPHQGGIFTVLGSSTVLLTIYAAREIYDFFEPRSALAIMALSVVFVAFMSVRYNRNALALAGLILASVAPLFTNSPAPDIPGLFTYLTVVVLGSLWIVYLRGWSNLTFTSLVIVFLFGLPYIVSGISSGDQDVALLFAFLFTAIFFIANIIGLICNENEENRQSHIAVGVGTGLYLIAWITGAADPEWQSLLYVMWMLVFSVGSFIVYRVILNRVPFFIYGGTSVALLAAATAAELSGPVLTIAFTIEIALLVLLTTFLLKNVRIASGLSWLFIGPVLLSFESLTAYAWTKGVLHDHFFVVLVLGISLLVVGRMLYEFNHSQFEKVTSMGNALVVLGSLYGLALIWLVLHVPSVLPYEAGTTFSLIIYTLIGLVLYIQGKREGKRSITIAGGVLLGFVIARLLLVEVWQMALTGRIITFLVIGLLLISTAFIKRNKAPGQILSDNNSSNV